MTLHSIIDQFDLLLDAPDSVSKLRQFILQLAVQGRLSEQDPSDEPAGQLLERMEAEKERLKAAGDHKYQKKMPPITKSDVPFSFPCPTGWAWVRFGSLGKIYGGGTPKKSNSDYWSGDIPWVSPKDMDVDVVRDTQDKISDLGVAESSAKPVPPGSVLIVGRSGILQRKLPVAINAVECTVNQDLKVLTPYVAGTERYIQLMLRGFQPFILDQLVKTGTTVESLKYTEFQLQPYPLPPLEEQQRIVATVDRLMDECDTLAAQQDAAEQVRVRCTEAATHALQTADTPAAVRTAWHRLRDHFDALCATPDDVDAVRQTILQLAVQGKLTEQDPSDEPAEKLLERIRAEKQRLYEAGEIRKPKDLPSIKATEVAHEVPSSWKWARLGRVILYQNGYAFKSSSFTDSGVGVVRIGDISEGTVTESDMRYLPLSDAEEVREKFRVKPGSLLLAMSGATTGKMGFNDSDKTYLLNQRVGMIDPVFISKHYIYNYLTTKIEQNLKKSAGSAIPNLSTKQIKETLIPLPPLEEQQRIVATVDRLMDACDALEAQLARRQALGAELLDAVLHAAVQGDGQPAAEEAVTVG